MRTHAPQGYHCPMCRLVRGQDTSRSPLGSVVHRDQHTLALICAKWWLSAPGHVMVVPTEHLENLYELPTGLGGPLMDTARRVALALIEVDSCSGTSLRQHNEPGGDQELWHLHVHVFPRWDGDDLYRRAGEIRFPSTDELLDRAAVVRAALSRIS